LPIGLPPQDSQTGIPSDAGPALSEHALDAELQAADHKAEAAARGWRNWSWLDRPITLWLLSTVAVGVLSFTYSNYSACRASLEIDSSRFARLSQELVLRVGGIYGLTLVDNVQASSFLLFLDPDRHFLFTEFKGRLPNELAAEVQQLLRKWQPSAAAEVGTRRGQGASNPWNKAMPSTTLLIEPGATPTTIAAFVKQLLAEPHDIFGLLEVWILMHRTLPVESSPESIAAATNWARALGNRAVPYFDSHRDGLGSTSICFKRTFWPFT
jgi:hypothetical protein